MAVLHQAEMRPPKIDLVATWISLQPWGEGLPKPEAFGSYRFDDPAGEVGIEFILASCGDQLVHVPLTYRDAPLAGADAYLVGKTEHSVLGTRYVYDGCADPVLVQALLAAVLSGAEQAELVVEDNGEVVEKRVPQVLAKGGGSTPLAEVPGVEQIGRLGVRREGTLTHVSAEGYDLTVAHLVGDAAVGGRDTLLVSWLDGQAVLAGVTPTS